MLLKRMRCVVHDAAAISGSTTSSDRHSRPYRGAEMLGRLSWDIRQAVGRDTANKFVVGAWQAFSTRPPGQSLKEFLTIFASAVAFLRRPKLV